MNALGSNRYRYYTYSRMRRSKLFSICLFCRVRGQVSGVHERFSFGCHFTFFCRFRFFFLCAPLVVNAAFIGEWREFVVATGLDGYMVHNVCQRCQV